MDRQNSSRAVALIFWAILAIVLAAPVVGAEVYLRLLGLGDPVLYYKNTSYRYAPAPNQHVKRRRGAEITIDSVGLRGVRDWTSPTDQRILFVGDSVTWAGTDIDDHEMFTTLTCERLTDILKRDMLCGNAGVNGYGVDNMVYRLDFDDPIRHADVIVVVLITADTVRGLADLQKMPFYSRKPRGPFKAVWEATGILMMTAANWLMHPDPPDTYRPPDEYPLGSHVLRVSTESTNRLIETLRAKQSAGQRVLLVFSPEAAELDDTEHLPLARNVRTLLAASRLPYLDLVKTVKTQYGKDFFIDGVHLERRGHAVYAKLIAAKIAELYGVTSGM